MKIHCLISLVPGGFCRAFLVALFCFGGGIAGLHANNIQVENVTLSGQDSINQNIDVEFDLAWENSWRVSSGPSNWDAAWVFVKFQKEDGVWRHATLSSDENEHAPVPDVTIRNGLTDGVAVGAFIYRAVDGSGDVNWDGLTLKWEYGADGVSDSSVVTVDVSAVEMVYIPEGAFSVGDGVLINSSTPQGFYRGEDYSSGGLSQARRFQITSENALTIGTGAGEIFAREFVDSPTPVATIPANFPKGYGAFYLMKYELSQAQAVDYANKQDGLTGRIFQYIFHDAEYSAYTPRQDLSGSVPNMTTASPDRAFSSRDFRDVLPYLDWAGLRPMTEFEYEKACRGPLTPVPDELPWGTAVGAVLSYTYSNDGTPDEAVATNYNINAGNMAYQSTKDAGNVGPLRCGIFALDTYSGTTSGRIQSGAGYYGNMNLGGNVQEATAGIGYSSNTNSFSGLGFDGSHGDGNVEYTNSVTPPDDDVPNWQGDLRLIYRGTYYDGAAVPVSDNWDNDFEVVGIRGARTAPAP